MSRWERSRSCWGCYVGEIVTLASFFLVGRVCLMERMFVIIIWTHTTTRVGTCIFCIKNTFFILHCSMSLLAIVLIGAVLIFEFINGFHDTANAVATVIYTKSLKPMHAVIYSWMLNFLWVLIGGVGVAFSIVKLIPVLKIASYGTWLAVLVSIAILLTAIIRNFLTWKRGLPCSSSHTLIGAVIGAVIGFCLLKLWDFSIVNRTKIKDILLGLLISPMFWLWLTFIIVMFFKKYFHNRVLFHRPAVDEGTPPWYIRGMLIATCGLVSFFHGSNDGQKWIGLAMVILALLMPNIYGASLETHIVPMRLIILISISLGLGTMIGWKRIVVTIGEKIGVDHLSYIQWAAAELVAACAIGASTHYHLPVSTTHVLSSGIVGAMIASGGASNVQRSTLRQIALAWILTLPVCLGVSAAIVYLGGIFFGL